MTPSDNSTGFNQLTDEQKHYVQVLANKKRLYAAHKTLNDAVQTALKDSNQTQGFKLAQTISAAAKQVQDTANFLTHQQKQIEQQHPEFKEKAKQFAQSRHQARKQDIGQAL